MQKFAFPASEYVLGGLLPDEEYHIWVLVARLTELIFGAGRDGWKQEMLVLARNLILRHNILVEETQGLKSCHVTLHNLVHVVDDIERSTNKKNIECTFAKAEAIREFLKFFRGGRTSKKPDSIPNLQAGDKVSYASYIEYQFNCNFNFL